MPGTTSTVLPSFSHDQHHETDAAKRKGGGHTCRQYCNRKRLIFVILFSFSWNSCDAISAELTIDSRANVIDCDRLLESDKLTL